MKTVEKEQFRFQVDLDRTMAYYQSHSVCTCSSCRNLYGQIQVRFAQLTVFLAEFGVDIFRPDEVAPVEHDGCVDYLFIGYTVTGSILNDGVYETDLGNCHIKISRGDTPWDSFPNEQTQPHFYITVTGITLPWTLDEPFPQTKAVVPGKGFSEKLRGLFRKSGSIH